MTQIRVHELASELNVSTQQVRTILEDLGQKVRGPSTVIGVSVAAKVRGRLRLPKSTKRDDRTDAPVGPAHSQEGTSDDAVGSAAVGDAAGRESAHSLAGVTVNVSTMAPASAPVSAPTLWSTAVGGQPSLFLPPVAPPVPLTAAPSSAAFSNPFAIPSSTGLAKSAPPLRSASPRAASPRTALPPPPPLVIEPEPDFDAIWEARGFSKSEQARWLAAGLRLSESDLAGRCIAASIDADELVGKLSGRTALQRLRDGEASTSVWARIREAEQAPRRAGTKLTGRFS